MAISKSDKAWEADRKRYRRYVASLDREGRENERFTVENEWHLAFVRGHYYNAYPHLTHDDLLSLVGR